MISSTAIFACSNITETLRFYKEVLGFAKTWSWGVPPTFGGASKNGVSIMFNLQPELAAHVAGHEHWINVDDVDGLYDSHRAAGANIVSELADRPWGVREYVVQDINGYRLRFAGGLSAGPKRSKPLPEKIRIVRRLPNLDEYLRVAGAAFNYRERAEDVLQGSWAGVVAEDSSGNALGVLRIMRDAPGWFSIWDVAVTPDWQAHGIGTAMMKEAVAAIREFRGEAIIYLFTYKDGFYERIGFNKESVSVLRIS